VLAGRPDAPLRAARPGLGASAITRGFAAAAFSPDGGMLALGGSHVVLIDAATLKDIRTVDLRKPTGAEWNGAPPRQPPPVSVLSLAFSPDGSTLAAGCEDGTLHLLKITPKDE
jgi:WD40 repeat protein